MFTKDLKASTEFDIQEIRYGTLKVELQIGHFQFLVTFNSINHIYVIFR